MMWLKKKPQQYTSPPMSFMPREILCKIFSYLSVRDLGRLSLVCKLFKEVSENDQLWKELFIERVKSFVKWEHSFHFNISSSKDFKVLFRDELISNPQNEKKNRLHRLAQITKFQKNDLRVSILGDRNVGKTRLLSRLAVGVANANYIPNDQEDFYSATVLNFDKTFYLTFIDSPGEHSYFEKLQRRLSLDGIDMFLLCFSLVDTLSFQNLKHFWIPLIKIRCLDTPILLIGCKLDQRDEIEEQIEIGKETEANIVPDSEATKLVSEFELSGFVSCSAVTQEFLQHLIASLLNNIEQQSFQLTKNLNNTNEKGCIIQ